MMDQDNTAQTLTPGFGQQSGQGGELAGGTSPSAGGTGKLYRGAQGLDPEFIADLERGPTHALVRDAIHILERLTHRGAAGADPESGDGAGILIQLPDRFLRKATDLAGFGLPAPGEYATGLVFFAPDPDVRN